MVRHSSKAFSITLICDIALYKTFKTVRCSVSIFYGCTWKHAILIHFDRFGFPVRYDSDAVYGVSGGFDLDNHGLPLRKQDVELPARSEAR